MPTKSDVKPIPDTVPDHSPDIAPSGTSEAEKKRVEKIADIAAEKAQNREKGFDSNNDIFSK